MIRSQILDNKVLEIFQFVLLISAHIKW